MADAASGPPDADAECCRWETDPERRRVLVAAFATNKDRFMKFMDRTPFVSVVETDAVTYHVCDNSGVEVWRTALPSTGDDAADAAALRTCVAETVAAICAAAPNTLFIEWDVHPGLSPAPELMRRVFEEDGYVQLDGHGTQIVAGKLAELAAALEPRAAAEARDVAGVETQAGDVAGAGAEAGDIAGAAAEVGVGILEGPAGFTAVRCRTAAHGRDFGRLFVEAYGIASEAWARQVVEGMAFVAPRDADSDEWLHYVGYLPGDAQGAPPVPVTCLCACLAAGVASFYFSGTNPQYRQLGLALRLRYAVIQDLMGRGVSEYVCSVRSITRAFLQRRGALAVADKSKYLVWAQAA